MTLDNYLQEAGALATLSGILAGFSFSAVVQFLSNDRKGRLDTAAIVVFSRSTLMFLFSLIIFIMGFAAGIAATAFVSSTICLTTWGLTAVVGLCTE